MKTRKRTYRILFVLAIILVISAVYIYFDAFQYKRTANRLIDKSGIEGGLIAHVGFDNGKLSSALHINERFIVHGISRDAEKIRDAREYLRKKNQYGKVTVQQWRDKTLPYSENLVSLLIIEHPDDVPRTEVMRVLSPEGVAFINRNGDWKQLKKPRPEGLDKWTHYLNGPDNNPVAQDSAIGPPRRLRWKSGPDWCRSHEYLSSFVNMVSDGKRVFYVFDDGLTSVTGPKWASKWVGGEREDGMVGPHIPQKWTLYARNAYNGVFLWKRSLKNWNDPESDNYRTGRGSVTPMMQRTLVTIDDRVFTTIEYQGMISILDAATGKTLRKIQGTNGTREIVYSNGTLYVRINPPEDNKKQKIAAINPDNGKFIWEKPIEHYNSKSLAVSNGKLVYSTEKALYCLSTKNGEALWKIDSENLQDYSWSSGPVTIIYEDQLLIRDRSITALRDLDTGQLIWETKSPYQGGPMRASDVFIIDSLVWHTNTGEIAGYSLKDGHKVKSFMPDSIFSEGHHLRCYRAKATSNYIIPQFRGLEFVDLKGKNHCQNDWTRGPCRYGVLPSNGLTYVPPHPCFCYAGAMMKGLNAYSTATSKDIEKEISGSPEPEKRLVHGPAWNEKTGGTSEDDNSAWTMYRHDSRRTNATQAQVPGKLSKSWELKIGGNLTPPVASSGMTYVSAKDRNTLYAIDMHKGEVIWKHSVGGRVDSPPTLYNEKVLFGSADGWVYCLRASDGKLIWRFQAAPSSRLMVHKNRVESPWRVHGSLLMHEDLVYLTSGRSSFLDGGIFIYALDPNTGKVVHKTRLDTYMKTREDAQNKPFLPAFHMEGANSDILVSEGGYIYLGQMKFTPSLEKLDPPYRQGPEDYQTDRGSSEAFGPIVQGKPKSENPGYDFVHKPSVKEYPSFANSWFRRGHMGAREVGVHLFATSGFLDNTYFNRTYWMYSNTWPGYYFSTVASKSGQLLVIGPEKTYGFKAYTERLVLSPHITPGKHNYLLFADGNDNEPVLAEDDWGRDKGMGYSRSAPPRWFDWVPVRVKAMVLAGDKLFMAGSPDVLNPEDPMAAFEGKKGCNLWSYNAENGEQKEKYSLNKLPVFDGMIAVENRILMSAKDGSLVCLKGKREE
jgi:outer membrane protein assembly factor BamB